MTICYHNYDKPDWIQILIVPLKGNNSLNGFLSIPSFSSIPLRIPLISSKINKFSFVNTRYYRVGRVKSVRSSDNNRSEELHRTRCLPELPDRSLDGATQAYYQRWTGTLCYSLINLVHYCKKSNLRFSEVYNLIVSIEYVTGWRINSLYKLNVQQNLIKIIVSVEGLLRIWNHFNWSQACFFTVVSTDRVPTWQLLSVTIVTHDNYLVLP